MKRTLLLSILIFLIMSISSSVSAGTCPYPELNAEAAVLMDANTGQVLFEKNLHEKHYPASITKVMTGMLALEKGNLTDIVTMSSEAVFSIGRNSSHVALDENEELALEDALYALSIASANDAANGIAEHISGNVENFAQSMNKKAIQVGAKNTNFVNPHGLPDDNHYTTAHDMAKIMMEAIKIPKFTEFFSETYYEMPPTNKQQEARYFHSRNSLLNGNSQYPGILASKSGWTSQANCTLITAAEQDDRKLVVVVINTQSRVHSYEDTITLLDYGFREFMDIKIDLKDLEETMPEAKFASVENEKLTRLLHKNISPDNLKKSYDILEAADEGILVNKSISVKQPQNFMYQDLGSILIDGKRFIETEVNPAGYTGETVSNNNKLYLSGGLGLICFYLFLFYLKRKRAIKRNRLRFFQKYRY